MVEFVSRATEPATYGVSGRVNYLTRHWRGELSLGVSYWVNGFLANLVAVLGVAILIPVENQIDLRIASALFLCVFAGIIAITVWQLVGIWRSASRHVSRGGTQAWAAIAKILVLLGVFSTILLVWYSYIPQSKEFLSILSGDTGLPPYKIQALPGGTEIEFRGGLRAGCARDLQRVLAANPKAEALDIESFGGRIGEARKMIQLIHTHGLATYTTQYCVSAAAFVLISGKERRIARKARVGFHTGRFPGATFYQRVLLNDIDGRMMRSAGVSEQFIMRVLATPPDKLWYPTSKEMLEARAINGVF
jgi:hypothetical protein